MGAVIGTAGVPGGAVGFSAATALKVGAVGTTLAGGFTGALVLGQVLSMKDGTATPTIRPPIVVDGRGDVLVFSDVTYASSYLEAIDVLEGAYPACYDSEGRLLTLSADGDVVDIRSDESEPRHQAELRSLLVDYLERVLDRSPPRLQAELRSLLVDSLAAVGHEKGKVADLPLQHLVGLAAQLLIEPSFGDRVLTWAVRALSRLGRRGP